MTATTELKDPRADVLRALLGRHRPSTAQEIGWQIRPLSAEDLPHLGEHLPSAPYRTHADDLAWQRTGAVTVLIAWHGSIPVGSGLIHWDGPRDTTIAKRFPGCPEIFRLNVLEDFRSQGCGTGLVLALEGLARGRGARRVGLGLAIDDDRARSLYEALGFRRVDAPVYVDRREYPDADGHRRVAEDSCVFMVHDLLV